MWFQHQRWEQIDGHRGKRSPRGRSRQKRSAVLRLILGNSRAESRKQLARISEKGKLDTTRASYEKQSTAKTFCGLCSAVPTTTCAWIQMTVCMSTCWPLHGFRLLASLPLIDGPKSRISTCAWWLGDIPCSVFVTCTMLHPTSRQIFSAFHGGPLSTAYDKPGYSISYYDILCCYIYIYSYMSYIIYLNNCFPVYIIFSTIY